MRGVSKEFAEKLKNSPRKNGVNKKELEKKINDWRDKILNSFEDGEYACVNTFDMMNDIDTILSDAFCSDKFFDK